MHPSSPPPDGARVPPASPPPAADAFTVSFHKATPHGVLTAVTLPATPAPVATSVLAQLHPSEAEHALSLRGFRQVEFVGGRLALRAARRQVGAPLGPVLADDRGAPTLPPGWVGSVSHKRGLVVGMVARAHDGTLGVDLEDRSPPRMAVAERVLRPSERAALARVHPDRQWQALLLRFSTKESIYKALDPYVRRYVSFDEAEVEPGLDGSSRVRLHLAHGEGPFAVDARFLWLAGRVLTTVRIRRGDTPDVK